MVDTVPELDPPSAENLDITPTRLLYLAVPCPSSATIHGGLLLNFSVFLVKVNADRGVRIFNGRRLWLRTPSRWTECPFFSPRALTAVSARGLRESPGVPLPGDSAHVCNSCSDDVDIDAWNQEIMEALDIRVRDGEPLTAIEHACWYARRACSCLRSRSRSWSRWQCSSSRPRGG